MQSQAEKLLDACILAGKILMENGAEMHRVEDTMNRILDSYHGDNEAISFVIPTGIFVTTRFGSNTKMKRILKRSNNLNRINEVNQYSRLFVDQKIDVDELYEAMLDLEKEASLYNNRQQIIAAGFMASFMMLLFQGPWQDFLINFFIASFGYFVYLSSSQNIRVRFLHEFIATLVMGIVTQICFKAGLVVNVDTVMIGNIIVLVPGIPIMNAVRDFLVGNTISGTVFLFEALFVASMIGAGVLVSLYFF